MIEVCIDMDPEVYYSSRSLKVPTFGRSSSSYRSRVMRVPVRWMAVLWRPKSQSSSARWLLLVPDSMVDFPPTGIAGKPILKTRWFSVFHEPISFNCLELTLDIGTPGSSLIDFPRSEPTSPQRRAVDQQGVARLPLPFWLLARMAKIESVSGQPWQDFKLTFCRGSGIDHCHVSYRPYRQFLLISEPTRSWWHRTSPFLCKAPDISTTARL